MSEVMKDKDKDTTVFLDIKKIVEEVSQSLLDQVEMAENSVKIAQVEFEDTYMIEDENDKRIEEQKCSDQYENSKEELEVEEEKLDFHDEVASYLGTLISAEKYYQMKVSS